MALVKKQADGSLSVAEEWTRVAEGEAVPAAGHVLVPLSALVAQPALRARRDLGVWLAPNADLTAVDLDGLAAIALDFPGFADGRAYSLARLLRDRHGWTGPLWAIGDVLIDQVPFMLRVGFDGFVPKKGEDLAAFERAIARFSAVYQPAADGRASVPAQRWRR